MQFEAIQAGMPAGAANFASVPQEMRSVPQWVVWRAVRSRHDDPNKFGKEPLNHRNLALGAVDTRNPANWGTFDEVMHCWQHNSSVVSGVGFVLTAQDPYLCFDVDDGDEVTSDHARARRQEWIEDLLATGSYMEWSPSRKGFHVWLKGTMAIAGRRITTIAVEVYGHSRFMTVTGLPLPQSGPQVLNGQMIVRALGLDVAEVEVTVHDDPAKPTDLTDAQLLATCLQSPNFAQRWHRTEGWRTQESLALAQANGAEPPEDWSSGYLQLVAKLNQCTGSVQQMRRLALQAPMVLQSPPKPGDTEKRWAKAERLFYTNLRRERAHGVQGDAARQLDPSKCGWAHGARVAQAVLAAFQAQRVAEQQARVTEAERQAAVLRQQQAELEKRSNEGTGIEGLSDVATRVLGRFDKLLTTEHNRITPPPGVGGLLTMAAERASKVPFMVYAIPCTLAVLGGMVSRAYQPDTGGGLNMNYVLLGKTATGKSSAMRAWSKFIKQAQAYSNGQLKNRIIRNGTLSIQGIYADFMETPGGTWFVDEAKSQLDNLVNPSGDAAVAFLGCFNQFYDVGVHDEVFELPRSMASKNAGFKPIRKLCVNTLLGTTPDSLQLTDAAIANGFMSRVTVVYYDGEGGLEQEIPDEALPQNLMQPLCALMGQADRVDAAYTDDDNKQMGGVLAAGAAATVDTSLVRELAWQLSLVCQSITRDANGDRLAAGYVMFARIPQSAMRVACCLAAADNPYAPVVRPEHLRWAFGYLLQCMGVMASRMDQGIVGDNRGDEERVAERVLRKMLAEGRAAGKPGLPLREVHRALGCVAPFRTHKLGRGAAAANCIQRMAKNGYLRIDQGGEGHKGEYVTLL
jgi:hypothetical protein